ncbi:MAG: response regulator [Chloroflexota bacterium]
MATVLVIEDDEENLALISSIVASLGNDVLQARNAQVGYDLLMEHAVDLILLDLRLPGMDGWEFASHMKNDANLNHIPIVAISVEVEKSDKRKAFDAGCDDYLPKPFPISALRAMLQQYL